MERICILSNLNCYQLKRYNDDDDWLFNASLMELQLKTYSRYTEEKRMGIKTYHYKNDEITNLVWEIKKNKEIILETENIESDGNVKSISISNYFKFRCIKFCNQKAKSGWMG